MAMFTVETSGDPLQVGQTYKHPQAGIEAVVTLIGKATVHEDDEEFGTISVDVPTVWYELFVDGRKCGSHHLPVAEFWEKFGLPDTGNPWD